MALSKTQLAQLRQAPVGESGNRVAEAMRLANLKQTAVAEATGFTQPYVSAVVTGRHQTITVTNASRLAQFFGCAIEDLFPASRAVA